MLVELDSKERNKITIFARYISLTDIENNSILIFGFMTPWKVGIGINQKYHVQVEVKEEALNCFRNIIHSVLDICSPTHKLNYTTTLRPSSHHWNSIAIIRSARFANSRFLEHFWGTSNIHLMVIWCFLFTKYWKMLSCSFVNLIFINIYVNLMFIWWGRSLH